MLDTLLKVIPFSLGGAVNPLGILIIFSFLAKSDRPLKRAWLFIAGSIVVLIALIFISKFLLADIINGTHEKTLASAIIDIVLGIILIFLAIFKKNKPKSEAERPQRNLWQVFVAGMVFMMILDVSTLVCYFASMKVILSDHLALSQNLIIYAVNIALVMSTMTFPVLVATLWRKKSEKILEGMHTFFVKYGTLVTKLVIAAIAVYLLYLGLSFFY